MRASELIAKLEGMIAEHGDCEVDHMVNAERMSVLTVSVGYRKILRRRERTHKFWVESFDHPESKGEKVFWL